MCIDDLNNIKQKYLDISLCHNNDSGYYAVAFSILLLSEEIRNFNIMMDNILNFNNNDVDF
jgi:hypothetical protein